MLLFASDHFKDIMWSQRQGENGYEWTVLKAADTDDYRKHNAAEYREPVIDRRSGKTYEVWKCRGGWPNHLFDCENMATAMAAYSNALDDADAGTEEKPEPEEKK